MPEEPAPLILVVDDNDAARYSMSRILHGAGFKTVEAATGQDALDATAAQQPDLVILDVHLPDMLGFEVCSRVKSDPQMRFIPVLHVSASFAEDEHKAEGLDRGADGYLTHPVEPKVLVATVRSLLRTHRAEEDLRRLNESLERRIAERTAEAEHRAIQVQALAADLAKVERRERQRLAQLLHDHVQQLLVAAKLQTGRLQKPLADEQRQQIVEQVESLLDQAISDSRSLNAQLSPRVLYESGLSAALEWLAREMRQRYQLKVDLRITSEPSNEAIRIVAFETAREFLFNVVKHAGVSEAVVSVHQRDEELLVSVEDSGTGFDHLPQPDDNAAMGQYGLFNIRRRLQLLGGDLEIQSRQGEGTRMTARLPMSGSAMPLVDVTTLAETNGEAGGQASRPAAPRLPDGAIIRILLVDDHKVVREGLAGLLEVEDLLEIVGEAADGLEAVEMAGKLKPDVILMDVSMPTMDGIEATRVIRRELPMIRVVALSMHDEESVATAMKEAGALAFIRKDAPATMVISTIYSVVKQNAPLAS